MTVLPRVRVAVVSAAANGHRA